MRPDELGPEVNRLYWETDEPVTRLADQLGVSRGTFYNHLEPLSAHGRCTACGGTLAFRTRSDRVNGAAHCGSCGREQRATARPGARRAAEASRNREGRALHVERAAGETPAAARHTREAELLAARATWLDRPGADDPVRTQLLLIAVGAAVLGLGVLYYARRRS